MRCPKLLITCPHGREERAIEEIMDILMVEDLNVECEKSKFPGVVLVYTSLDPLKAAKMLYEKPTSYIFRIVPVFKCVKTDIENIVNECLNLAVKYMKSKCRFYVDCIRRGRRVSSSVEVERKVGIAIAERLKCTVDFENPDYIVKVEVVDEITCISILKRCELFKKEAKPR